MNVLDWLREGELKAATIKFKEALAKCRDEQQRRAVQERLGSLLDGRHCLCVWH